MLHVTRLTQNQNDSKNSAKRRLPLLTYKTKIK